MLHHIFTKLSSGLNVVRIPMPGVNSVTVLALANTGSRYEAVSEQGIAHFFEHIVFKGTKNYSDAQVLAGAIDAIGADFNAFTSKEYTGYYVKSASSHIETSLDVVSDMLLAPNIKQEDIDREKGVIIEEINMYEDNPASKVGNLFETLLFDGSGLGHDILGTKETVSSITSADFRRFLKKWYGLNNMVLVVSGDAKIVESEKTLDLITKYFGKETEPRENKRVNTQAISQKELKISQEKLSVTYKKTEQAHLCIGWLGLEREDSRRYALSLLSTVLGANMSSRLFTEVREKRGLCYYVHSDTDFYHNTGIFGASAGVDPNRIEEAISVMLSEFYGLVDGSKPVTEDELKKAKDYVSGSMVLGLEDSRSVAQFFGMRKLLTDEIKSPTEVLEAFEKVTLKEVQDVAKDLIKKGECRLAVIGPFKSETKFKKLLGIK
ncbi:insulinase family protein [Candidatus Woesebacteria bacterium]|nr:insulinase family protein [Candidatus Woesebacteria bacterium]